MKKTNNIETEIHEYNNLSKSISTKKVRENQYDLAPQQSPPITLEELRTYTPAPYIPNNQTLTPEEVNNCFNYSVISIDYGGEIKNDMIMCIAEVLLIVKSEIPAERARFLPPIQKSKSKCRDNDLTSQEFLNMLNMNRAFPFLVATTYYDRYLAKEGCYFKTAMLCKAYSILREFGINTENPYLIDIESLIPPESSFRLGLYQNLPFTSFLLVRPLGDMLIPKELYCMDDKAFAGFGQIWPLRSLVQSNSTKIIPYFLPYNHYSLWGYEKLSRYDGKTVILTPSLYDYCLNTTMDVISWYGGEYTLGKVDFTPLAERTVLYVYNPYSFKGNVYACAHCMQSVMSILKSINSNVIILSNPAWESLFNKLI